MSNLVKLIMRKFRRNEEGSIAIEAVLIFPILCWAYLGTFVFFDAFRTQSNSVKATYTIADMLSREDDAFTPNYMSALWRLQKFLTTSNKEPRLRISEVQFSAAQNKNIVIWSQTRGTVPVMTTARLQNYTDQIPFMPDGEKVVIVETWLVYEPIFTFGLDAMVFQSFIATRPRFASQLCWSTVNNNWTPANLTC